jgi:alkylhydroperoxidase family enzyme
MGTRIVPAQPPYAEKIQACFNRLQPKGIAPLALFTTLARDQRLFERLMNGAPLDVVHLTLRQREIVIDRVTALCGSEYEWGVHIAFFARRVGLSDEQIASTAKAGGADPVWSEQERLLLSTCDQLHANCDIDETSWRALQGSFSDEAILEIIMLAGYYRMISYFTNALKLPLEPYGTRFPASPSAEALKIQTRASGN